MQPAKTLNNFSILNTKIASLGLCAVLGQPILLAGCGDPPSGGDDEVGDDEAGDDEAGDDEGCVPQNSPIELESCETLPTYITGELCLPSYDECHQTYFCTFGPGDGDGDGDPPIPEGGCPICADSKLAADNICRSEDFLDSPSAYAQEAPCYLLNSSCSGWNPASEITINVATGATQLEQTFIDSVIADPNVLVQCDTARLTSNATGPGFVVSGAVAGDLLYGLGLRNGDMPTEINNYPLDDYLDVISAFIALSYTDPSTYTIEVERPGVGTIYIAVDAI